MPRGPGPLLSRRPRRLITVEKTRYPRFLGDPCVHAPLFDPGGPPAPGHYRTGDVVFRTLNNVDSAFAPFEARSRGLHALCVRFAAGVAPGPRNTRFRLVASLDRAGLSPAGSHRWFTVMSFRLHGVLHHQASPGASKDGLGSLLVAPPPKCSNHRPRFRRRRRLSYRGHDPSLLLRSTSLAPLHRRRHYPLLVLSMWLTGVAIRVPTVPIYFPVALSPGRRSGAPGDTDGAVHRESREDAARAGGAIRRR